MLAFLFLLFTLCNGYNILIAVPSVEKSEFSLLIEITSGLLNAGHNVTLITGHRWEKQHDYLEQVWIPETQNSSLILDEAASPVEWQKRVFELTVLYFKQKYMDIWKNAEIMKIWKKRETYDLFITLSFYAEGIFPFIMDNNIPFVQVVAAGAEFTALLRNGNLLSPAVVPSSMVLHGETMTFWERTINLLIVIGIYTGRPKLASEYLKPVYKLFPELGDIERYYDRISLTLINNHYALDGPIPLLPNEVEIGCIQCRDATPLEKVDKNLIDFIEGSGESGVIYFSLGSFAKSFRLPKDVKETLLEAFRRIPQRVLWKYEEENLVHPSNVFIKKWLPQQDILGHPKTTVFISHCGLLSTHEAKYHGVPVLGIPLMFDQLRNCAKMREKGQALILNWESLTAEKVVQSLNTLISDTSYRERMAGYATILRDQPNTATERAVWWLEYIIRHKGAPHLQYAGKRLSIFQYVMLDVLLFWMTLFGALIGSLVLLLRFICCRNKKKKVTEDSYRNKRKFDKKIQ